MINKSVQHLETTAVKIGFNLGIFKYLTKLSHPATVEEIAEVTGSDSKLLGMVNHGCNPILANPMDLRSCFETPFSHRRGR